MHCALVAQPGVSFPGGKQKTHTHTKIIDKTTTNTIRIEGPKKNRSLLQAFRYSELRKSRSPRLAGATSHERHAKGDPRGMSQVGT